MRQTNRSRQMRHSQQLSGSESNRKRSASGDRPSKQKRLEKECPDDMDRLYSYFTLKNQDEFLHMFPEEEKAEPEYSIQETIDLNKEVLKIWPMARNDSLSTPPLDLPQLQDTKINTSSFEDFFDYTTDESDAPSPQPEDMPFQILRYSAPLEYRNHKRCNLALVAAEDQTIAVRALKKRSLHTANNMVAVYDGEDF